MRAWAGNVAKWVLGQISANPEDFIIALAVQAVVILALAVLTLWLFIKLDKTKSEAVERLVEAQDEMRDQYMGQITVLRDTVSRLLVYVEAAHAAFNSARRGEKDQRLYLDSLLVWTAEEDRRKCVEVRDMMAMQTMRMACEENAVNDEFLGKLTRDAFAQPASKMLHELHGYGDAGDRIVEHTLSYVESASVN